MRIKSKVLVILITFLSVTSIFGQYRIDKLKDVREGIKFPELTSAEKRVLAEQAQIFFTDLYVNKYQKLEMYGDSPSYADHVDPVSEINKIADSLDNLSTEDLEIGIQKIFVNQRDLHLNYMFPSPYSNYLSFIPVTFTRVSSQDNFFEVRVNGKYSSLLPFSIGNQRVPEIGDIVLSYDEMPILDAVDKFKQTSQGANEYGSFSRALGQMTLISQRTHTPPQNDSLTITFQSAKTGEIYSVNFDWLCQWKVPASDPENSINADLNPEGVNRSQIITEEDFLNNDDIWQTEFNKFAKQNNLETNSVFPNNPTNEPVVKWGLVEKDGNEYGYLKITSFVPEKGTDYAISEIVRIINKYFDNTTGLIIDVRNNGGGSIVFADKLSQLFIPGDAKAIQARLLNTDLNRYIFNESDFGVTSNPQWKEVINNVAGTSNKYSAIAPFTTTYEANLIGQVYYKPVAVITNARSYSATDLFSCAMQDNNAAVIFGEDPQTGAGGANVIEHDLFAGIVGAPFQPLPTDHRMRVSWRQSVRFGHHEGMLIEDHGCIADIDISQIPTDIIDGGLNQLNTITDYLNSVSHKYKSYVLTDNDNSSMYLSKGLISLEIKVSNTEHVDLYIDGIRRSRKTVYIYGDEQSMDITLPSDLDVNKSYNVSIVGKDGGNTPIWNMKRIITILEPKIVLDDNGLNLDFKNPDSINKLSILNNNTDEADGWNLKGEFLAVGLDPLYKNQIDTDAVIFLDLTNRVTSTLNFILEGLTEENYDFLRVYITSKSGYTELYSGSGYLPKVLNSFDISSYSGQDDVAIHFRFISDQMVDGPGIRISTISVD